MTPLIIEFYGIEYDLSSRVPIPPKLTYLEAAGRTYLALTDSIMTHSGRRMAENENVHIRFSELWEVAGRFNVDGKMLDPLTVGLYACPSIKGLAPVEIVESKQKD